MLDETKQQAVAKIGQFRPASRTLIDDVGHLRVGRDVSSGDPFPSGEGWYASLAAVDQPESLKMGPLIRICRPFSLLSDVADSCSSSCTIGHPMDPQAWHLPVRRLCLLLEGPDFKSAVREVPRIRGGLPVHRHGEMAHHRVPAVPTDCSLLDLLRRGKHKTQQSVENTHMVDGGSGTLSHVLDVVDVQSVDRGFSDNVLR